jgi:glycosyltransferase involved in cell wall biosynthesis
MISILILTLNEESNLPGCLDSVAWSDDVVVFDSFSVDRTVEIARAAGARVVQRKFDNYAAQRNAALQIGFKHAWVLMVDADERVPLNLKEEMLAVIERAGLDTAMFRMRRMDFFMGRWIRRSSGYPTWFGRLIRVGRVHVEREVNEEYHADGKVEHLQGHLHHYPFNKGLNFWFERHNLYSSMEACKLIEELKTDFVWRGLLSNDPVVRRKAAKQLAARLPARPLFVLAYLLLIRGGFLDGWPGINYAFLRSFYEYMIVLKMKELERRRQNLPF